MSDLTVYAESLIATVARAFYDDDIICLIDVLLRDKFLRDDDMGPRLSLPARQLRKTLQFLTEEHLVKFEAVDDLSTGGSQATKYWYIDYNHAVNTIRLRIYLLRKQLEEAETSARSNSFYLCPGYIKSYPKRCNGRYTETEAQQMVDTSTGLFLCQECVNNYEADPNPPNVETYTLRQEDNTKALKLAMDNMRHVNVQLSGKMIGNNQIRAGIYDLLQKVRVKGKGPLTSNLPSENIAIGIGSTRLKGTGRTAGIKRKKEIQQGIVTASSSDQKRIRSERDWMFLKNAMGQELALEVEKGGGARANLLATRRWRRRKLLDAAASRIGLQVPIYWKLKQRRKKEQEEKESESKKRKTAFATLEFLKNNIGRTDEEVEVESHLKKKDYLGQNGDGTDSPNNSGHGLVLIDDTDEQLSKHETERKAIFQAQYIVEIGRQMDLLQSGTGVPKLTPEDSENGSVPWEDG